MFLVRRPSPEDTERFLRESRDLPLSYQPVTPGTGVAVQVHHLGFWSLNGCRVLYSIGDGETEYGFAYGTLSNHAGSGEEIFLVRRKRRTGNVEYVIRAVSKPRVMLARLGYPLTRSLQARFRQDSSRALRRSMAGEFTEG
jgi:uncharacterized protein (UPF0548 family)